MFITSELYKSSTFLDVRDFIINKIIIIINNNNLLNFFAHEYQGHLKIKITKVIILYDAPF